MAYGQTGSGKSYSVPGHPGENVPDLLNRPVGSYTLEMAAEEFNQGLRILFLVQIATTGSFASGYDMRNEAGMNLWDCCAQSRVRRSGGTVCAFARGFVLHTRSKGQTAPRRKKATS